VELRVFTGSKECHKCQRDPAAFFSGDDALQAAVAALACSVGILTIGALVMLMLPVGVG
jgi:hypothetical protein